MRIRSVYELINALNSLLSWEMFEGSIVDADACFEGVHEGEVSEEPFSEVAFALLDSASLGILLEFMPFRWASLLEVFIGLTKSILEFVHAEGPVDAREGRLVIRPVSGTHDAAASFGTYLQGNLAELPGKIVPALRVPKDGARVLAHGRTEHGVPHLLHFRVLLLRLPRLSDAACSAPLTFRALGLLAVHPRDLVLPRLLLLSQVLLGVAPHLAAVDLVPRLVEGAVLAVAEVELLSIDAARVDPDVHVGVLGVLVHKRRGPRPGEAIVEPRLCAGPRLEGADFFLVGEDRAVVRARAPAVVAVLSSLDLLSVLGIGIEPVSQICVGPRLFNAVRHVVEHRAVEAVHNGHRARDVPRVGGARLWVANAKVDDGSARHSKSCDY